MKYFSITLILFILSIKAYCLNPITGPGGICTGQVVTFSDASPAGTWSSSNTAVAVIGSTGICTGISTGITTITYDSSGVSVTLTLAVDPQPIAGSLSICNGGSVALSNAATGGTWSSNNTTVANFGTPATSSIIFGYSVGTATVTYTIGTGCNVTATVTVNPFAPISGVNHICIGQTTTLSNAITGGTWTSGSTGIATIDASTGFVTSVAAGNSLLSYTLPSGCAARQTITINAAPPAILGATCINTGSTTVLSDALGSGTWVSGNTSVATVSGDTVTGIIAGSAAITYTGLSTGCATTGVVTVGSPPLAITGLTGAICSAATASLSDATTGGTWTSGHTSVATVNTSGLLTAGAAGTAVISYSVGTGGCPATQTITVNPLTPPITVPGVVCTGNSITLSDAITGGSWSTSSSTIVSVGSSSGICTGISSGTATVTYDLLAGCSVATAIVTVSTPPAAISGGLVTVCAGLTASLSDGTAGGTWTSSNSLVARAGSTGVVTGLSAGAVVISYSVIGSCPAITTITVNPSPAAITGASVVCTGSPVTLSNSVAGGVWSSSNTALATIGTSSGICSGSGAGTAAITYTLPAGCFATMPVTTGVTPSAITGPGNLCATSSISLSDVTPGGVWSSNNSTVATIGSTTGTITGGAAGTAIISYMVGSICPITSIITVNALPAGITGPAIICKGATATLSDISPGGAWSSSNTAVATFGTSSGVCSGINSGTAVVTYTLSTGCAAMTAVTVGIPLPGITGASAVCTGVPSTFSDATTGGTWSTSNTFVATIGASTGIATGVSTGTIIISYKTTGSCPSITTITVNPSPAAIAGPSVVCTGTPATFSDNIPGGAWGSSATTVATIGTSGICSGIGSGTTVITYTLPARCIATTTVTAGTTPAAITGPGKLCASASASLSDATASGVWTSNRIAIATIGTASGAVSGLSAGTATISYLVGSICPAVTTITVNPMPATFAVPAIICTGGTGSLSDVVTGGVWNSSATSVATIDSFSGISSGIGSGSATITYTLPAGCFTTASVIVGAPLPAISGAGTVCAGLSTPLSDATPGGTWTSSNALVATVGTATGIVGGMITGNSIISYQATGRCPATMTITVNPSPATITGPGILCTGGGGAFSDAVPGGAWSSSNTAVAVIGTSGVCSGIGSGSSVITYTLSAGCFATMTVTVGTPLPSITGSGFLCNGMPVPFSDATAGGTWTSSNNVVAMVGSATGIVTGLSVGTAIISYQATGSCPSTTIITINPSPTTIAGPDSVCTGAPITLSDGMPGGTWSSSATAIATVGSSGICTGISAGTATVTYMLPAGCFTSSDITVGTTPSAITGSYILCEGGSTLLSDATTGGAWSSSKTVVATAGATTGNIAGVSGGTAIISYMVGGSCPATKTVTINPSPLTVIGPGIICTGATTVLSDVVTGGTWGSANTAIATINATSGVFSGIAAGTDTITYTLPAGCFTTVIIGVGTPLPPIVGMDTLCSGVPASFSDAAIGGTWSSSNIVVAGVGAATGIVTGSSAGTAIISYLATGSCPSTDTITVHPSPAPVSGLNIMCTGAGIALSDGTPGGAWSSSDISVVTVGASGVCSGIGPGTASIIYTLPGGCSNAAVVTVGNAPPPVTASGPLCAGVSTSLSDALGGGTWTSSNPAVATIGASSGTLNGVSFGTSVISYIAPGSCYTLDTVTIYISPVAISGTMHVCPGAIIKLSDATPGGNWSSGSTSVASINVITGFCSGVSTGITAITYVLSSGCAITTTFTVDALPVVGPITGPDSVCILHAITVSDTAKGGVWTGTNSAAVVTNYGVVLGVTEGLDTIIYTVTNACGPVRDTFNITVLSLADCNVGTREVPYTLAGLKVYPNPNEGTFTVNVAADADEEVKVEITNVMGEKVKAITTVTNKATDIQLNEPAGIYIISAITANGRLMEKVIVR